MIVGFKEGGVAISRSTHVTIACLIALNIFVLLANLFFSTQNLWITALSMILNLSNTSILIILIMYTEDLKATDPRASRLNMETEKEMPKEDLVDISEHKVSRSAEVLLFHLREAGSDEITGSQDNTAKICDNSFERLVPDNAPVSTEEPTSAEAESTSDGSSQTLLSDSNALKIERLQCLQDLLDKKKLAISLLGKAQEYEKENPARERLDVLELNKYKVENIDEELGPAKRIEFLVTPSRRHLSKRLQTEFIIALILETKRFELILNELRSVIGTKLF